VGFQKLASPARELPNTSKIFLTSKGDTRNGTMDSRYNVLPKFFVFQLKIVLRKAEKFTIFQDEVYKTSTAS
jgi:hypothetical protein